MVRKPWFAKKTIWASQASADSGQPCEKTIGCASFGPQSLKKMFVPSLVVMVVMSWFLSVWRRGVRPGETTDKIGRASCRERGCTYVWIPVVAVSLKKKKRKKNS